MANNGQITIDVGVKLQVLQSSVDAIQKMLDNLKPDSLRFKELNNILAAARKEMERLQIQASKPFGNQGQFDKANKSIDKIEESLDRAQLAINKISFKDLKLDSSQQAQVDAFTEQIKQAKQSLVEFKELEKQGLFNNDIFKEFADSFDANLVKKSFDQVVSAVEEETAKIDKAIIASQNKIKNYENQIQIGKRIEEFTKNGGISKKNLGDDFDKIFTETTKGIRFKPGGQSILFDWLKSQFNLSSNQIDELVKLKTAPAIQQLFSGDDANSFFKKQLNAANRAETGYINEKGRLQVSEQAATSAANANQILADSQRNVNEAEKDAQTSIDKSTTGLEQLTAAILKTTVSNDGLKNGFNTANGQLQMFRQQLTQTNTQFLQLQRSQQTFNSMKSAIINFMGFNQVLNITKRAVKEAANHIKELDTTMNGIAIVTNMTTADLWNQVGAYSEMAQKYGTSIQGAYEVSKIYYQAGYETNEVLTLMNETLKLSKISGLDYATTTDYMMTATRGFHMEVSEAAKVVDVYSALAANTAVSQKELAEAMTRTASSMEAVGTTFEEASAMIATMVATTRESASNIGSAMKSIASRYGELTKDPAKLMDAEGEAMSFNKVDAALKSVGISLQTTDHQFRSFTDVILELSEVWNTLDSAQQRYIATQFAGNRQQSRFLALVSNPEQIRKNLEVAQTSEDTGTLQALKALDSLESKLNQVQVAYQQFYTSIGVEGVWKAFLDGAKNAINTLNSLPKLFGKIPLGAVTIIYDVISLMKNAALKGLTEIVSIWQKSIKELENVEPNTQQTGEKAVDGVVRGIVSRSDEIKKAMQDAVNQNITGEQKVKTGQQFLNFSNQKFNTQSFSLSKADEQLAMNGKPVDTTQFENLLVVLQALGNAVPDVANKIPQLKEAFESGRYTEVAATLNEIKQQAKITGEEFILAGQKAQQGANGFKTFIKDSKHLASDMTGLAQALNMVGSLINTTGRQGQIASGSLMSLSGAFRLGSIAVQAFQGTLNGIPWMAIATGVISIINGISTFIETPTEKLERLTKEAEELNNQAKQAKAEYNTLQRSIDKLDELEQKRYDSAEAAEEYQTAVDELANQFPNLITSLDDTGNATIETANLEYELEKAREAAAEATLNAAKAERQAAQQKLDIAQNTLKENTNTLVNNIEGYSNPSGEDWETFKKSRKRVTDLNDVIKKADWINLYNNNENIEIPDFLGSSIPSNEQELFTFLYSQFGTESGIGFNADGSNFVENIEKFQELLKNNPWFSDNGPLHQIALAYEEVDETLDASNTQILDISSQIKELKNLEDNKDEFDKKVGNILSDLDKMPEVAKLFQPFYDWASQYQADRALIEDYEKTLESTEKVELSAEINTYGKEYQEFVKNLGDANGILVQYLNDQANAFEDGDIDAYINEKLKNDYQEFMNAYNSLVPEMQEKFLDMWKNRSQYTAKDFKISLDLKDTDPVLQGIQNYYNEQINFYKDNLLKKITSLKDITGLQSVSDLTTAIDWGLQLDLISKTFAEWLTEAFDLIQDYSSHGLEDTADGVATQLNYLLTGLNAVKDPLDKSVLTSIITQNSITSIEGIDNILKAIEGLTGAEFITGPLEQLKNKLIYNLPLAIQAYSDEIVGKVDDIEKQIKNLSKGVTFSEAIDILDKINSDGDKQVSLNDLLEKDGKFYVKDAELRERYINNIIAQETSILNNLENRISNVKNLNLDKLQESAAFAEEFSIKDYQEEFELLKDLGYVQEILKDNKPTGTFKFIKDLPNISEISLSSVIIDILTQDFANAKTATEYLEKTLPAQLALEAGDYQEYLNKLIGESANWFVLPDLDKIATGEIISNFNFSYEQIKPIKDKLNSVYSSLISDVLSKGFDQIHLEDYQGLINDGKDIDLTSKTVTKYQDFIKQYAIFTGKTLEETNALIVQAIEKDTQSTTGAAADAIKNLTWSSARGGMGSLKDIQSLADALQIPINQILGSYNEALDQYTFNFSSTDVDLSQVDNFADVVKDSIESFLKALFDNVTKGITGKLTNADITTLQGQLNAIGLGNIQLDFKETVDGLKLSQTSAIALYNELKKVDSLQAQLTFDELAKSLEASNENYTNISTVLKHIADLHEKINSLEPGDARLQMYENELAVAEEIARVRSSTDNKDFDFMNHSLSSGMQNPIDYWNATGKAYKAMNESAKSGYMEIQDFYNIVNEMNNMAAVSGQTLTFMGQELNGSAESAASLIEAGFSALTNIKGDGVKIALGKIGADFETGAAAMTGDFDSGIKEMARSQIKMLDAAINMLEAIVAMQEIDVDGDGIELGEIFTFSEDGKVIDFTEQTDAWLKRVEAACGDIEIGGKSLREALLELGQINPDKAVELMNSLKNIDWTLGDMNVFAQIQQVLTAFFPGRDIIQGESIFDLLKIPAHANETSAEFKQWCDDIGLEVEQANNLIELMKRGSNVGTIDSTYGKAIQKLLGINDDQHLQDTFKDFLADGKHITTTDLKQWVNISDLEFDDEGNITKAEYTASDGVVHPLSIGKGAANQWQNEIAEIEQKVLAGQQMGVNSDKVNLDKSKITSITLSNGTTVNGVITDSGDGVITASYDGESADFSGPGAAHEAYEWIKKQAETKLYHIGETSGTTVTTNTLTGELEVVPTFTITGDKTDKTDQSVKDLVGMALTDAQDYIEANKISDGKTFTLPDIPIEFAEGTSASRVQEIVDTYFGDDTFDALPGKIAEGITAAFSGDAGAQIGAAIATGLATAFGSQEGQVNEFPINDITLKPTSVTVDISGVTSPSVTGIPETGIPIESIDVTATTANLTATKVDESTLEVPPSISKESLKIIYETLNLTSSGDDVDETNVYIPKYLTEHPTLTANLASVLLKSITGETEYNDDDVDSPSEPLKNKLTAIAYLLNVLLKSNDETAFNGYVMLPSNTEVSVFGIVQGIVDLVKLSSGADGATITSSSKVTLANGEQITLSDAITAVVYSLLLKSPEGEEKIHIDDTGVSVDGEHIDISSMEGLVSQLILGWQEEKKIITTNVTPTQDDLNVGSGEATYTITGIRYVSAVGAAREKVLLDNLTGSGDVAVGDITTDFGALLNYLQQIGQYVGTGGLLTNKDFEIFNALETASELTIPQSVIDTLTSIQGLDLSGFDLTTTSGFVSCLTALNDLNKSNSQETNTLFSQISTLTAGELPNIATALSDIASAAERLQVIPWTTIAEGIQSVAGAQSNPNNPNFNPASTLGTLSLDVTAENVDATGAKIEIASPVITSSGAMNVSAATVNVTGTKTNTGNNGGTKKSPTVEKPGQKQKLTGKVQQSTDTGTGGGKQTVNLDVSKAVAAIGALQTKLDSFSTSAMADGVADAQTAANKFGTAMKSTMNSVPNSKTVNIKVANTSATLSVLAYLDVQLRNVMGSGNVTLNRTVGNNVDNKKQITTSVSTSSAKGRKGPAAVNGRKKTLMGELGPELVVSNGRYYVVGQNGAEFVDLANDAIVFNHIQTKRLLQSGKASRGIAFTNEKNAVSLATGNVEGPAKASAAAALAALKELRAMWQSMLDASAKDLGSKAGSGRGGGGGGGGGGKSKEEAAGYIHDLEIWYNLLRQIAKLEKDITYQEQLQAKIISDRHTDGKALYASYKKQSELLDEEITKNKQLVSLQRDKYIQQIEQTNSSAFGNIFKFTENGLMQMNSDLSEYIKKLAKNNTQVFGTDGKLHISGTNYVRDADGNIVKNKKGKAKTKAFNLTLDKAKSGLDLLAYLNATNENGAAVYTAEEQVAILKAYGFGNLIKYDSNGKAIDTKSDDAATKMVESFWNQYDSIVKDNDDLFDALQETEKSILEQETKRNELLQKIVDNQLEVEDAVVKAIESREQKEIDRAKEERDKTDKANQKFLKGLSDSLSKEREMYERNADAQELTKMQRQLAILQRSGGFASQIRSLREQIDTKQQDTYFDKQQQQIDAIQEASDKQIERLDTQIDLMTETLEYQKENGLLWNEVRDIMAGTPEQIVNFIQNNTPEYSSNSQARIEKDLDELIQKVEVWTESRDDKTNPLTTEAGHDWKTYEASLKDNAKYKSVLTTANLAEAKQAFEKEMANSSDPVAAGRAADAVFQNKLDAAKATNNPSNNNAAGSSSSSSKDAASSAAAPTAGTNYKVKTPSGANLNVRKSASDKAKVVAKLKQGAKVVGTTKKGKWTYIPKKKGWVWSAYLKKYAEGGLIDYTGPAWVDGSKHKPESILNADQTEFLRKEILGSKVTLSNLISELQDTINNTGGHTTYNNGNETGVNIENLSMNLNVQSIANDYDAKRAGQMAFNEMLKIARKTGTTTVTRR